MHIDDVSLGGLSIAALAAGLIAATWSKIKLMAWRIANLLVCQATIEFPGATVVGRWLWKHGRRSRFGVRQYNTLNSFIKSRDRRMTVGFEETSRDSFIMWIGWRPLWANNNISTSGNYTSCNFNLWYIRGMFDMDRLMTEAVAEFNELQHGGLDRINGLFGKEGSIVSDREPRFRVMRRVGCLGQSKMSRMGSSGMNELPGKPPSVHEIRRRDVRYIDCAEDDLGQSSPAEPLAHLAFPPNVESVVEDIRHWLESEKRFKSRSIPWRMSLGFVGKPGTGKSSLAKGIAQRFDMPLLVLEMPTLLDYDLIEIWHEAMAMSPCVVLIEDIDTVFHGRKNITENEEKLSFGCLLNCLSGVEGADGILTIITTNHPETLDPALGVVDETGMSSRPGRIDHIVELGYPDESCRRKIASRILDECPGQIEETVKAGDGLSGAQFTQKCCDLAKEHYRKKPTDSKEDQS